MAHWALALVVNPESSKKENSYFAKSIDPDEVAYADVGHVWHHKTCQGSCKKEIFSKCNFCILRSSR